jgi:hypothetical protein
MLTQSEACERKRQLLQDLLQVLSRVSRIRGNHTITTRQSPADKHSRRDDMLQNAVDEQQQALRAIEDHQQKHGC